MDSEVLRIQLLGTFRVTVENNSIGDSEWYLRKARSLIKLLALAATHRMHRGKIMDLLWPELDVNAAANNLHKVLYVARRVLEPQLAPKGSSRYLQLNGDLVTLNVTDAWIDTVEFQSAGESALAQQHIEVVRKALALYTGELLPEDRYEDWTIRPREELRQLNLALLLHLAELHEGRGEAEEAIDVLRQVIGIDEANEPAHIALMRLLASSGRRQAALRQYALLSNALQRELGAEPDAGTQRLHAEILAGEFVLGQSPPAEVLDPSDVDVSKDLVGRDGLLDFLRARVDALFEQHGGIVLMHGDAGVGKSSLADFVEQRAVQRGAISLWGAAYRGELQVPYGVLGMMLEGFAVRIGAQTLRSLADECAVELARLAPAFSRVLDGYRREELMVDVSDEARMTRALIQFFSTLSTRVPLVITIEDLHCADDRTVHFLEYLAPLISELQILIVCTFRSEGLSVRSDLGHLFSQGNAGQNIESIEVQPLNRAEIAALAEKLLGASVTDEVLTLISDISEGSPYYAEEAISALRGRRRIQQQNGVWAIKKGIRVDLGREDVRKLVDAAGDFQLVKKLRTF